VFLDALPLPPNSTVDWRALLEADVSRFEPESTFVALPDTLERQLTVIWEEVLDIRPIGVEENFFALGGHSLLVVRLFAHLEKVFGRDLPLALLLQAPTVAQLARLLREDGWVEPWAALVAIQPEGSKPPLFCAEVPGRSVRYYGALARHLGPEQPLYVLQAQGRTRPPPAVSPCCKLCSAWWGLPRVRCVRATVAAEEVPTQQTRVEELAAHYLQEIRLLQPTGPYFLGGYGAGGQVAFEMARQLQAQGQTVALLALFDAYAAEQPEAMSQGSAWRYKVAHLGQQVQHYIENLRLFGPQDSLAAVLAATRAVCRRRKGAAPKTTGLALQAYKPPVYAGRVTLFRARQQPAGCASGPYLGWQGLAARGVETHDIPGYYGSIICEPRVRLLAAHLQACLENAQAIASATPR
jgi:aspartate racemase